MDTDHNQLFTKTDINGITFRNRFAVAPMTRVSAAEDGSVTEIMTRYYERFARGGFGLLITEGIYTDQAHSQGYIHQPGMSDERQAASWRSLVQTSQHHGARVFAQIMHAGAISQGNRFSNATIAPSPVQPKGKQMEFYYGKDAYPVPDAISEEQIADAIQGFASAASRAVNIAGFDGVEIHGANGYLIDQFLTDYANHRSDEWGGNTKKRVAFMLAVFKAVRESVGNGVPVGVRISQGKVNDFTHKWADGERDSEIIFGSLADAGVDFIHVTEFEAWQPAFAGNGDSLVTFARRYAPNVRIIANGSLHEIARAKQVIQDGADIVALGRGALANPDFPNRVGTAQLPAEFDRAILGPIADIKASEVSA